MGEALLLPGSQSLPVVLADWDAMRVWAWVGGCLPGPGGPLHALSVTFKL